MTTARRRACRCLPLGLLLLACGTARAPEKPHVALVMKSLANEFFKTMEDGARAHQQAHPADYELLATGIKDEQDVAGQGRLGEQKNAQGGSADVVAPPANKGPGSACQRGHGG